LLLRGLARKKRNSWLRRGHASSRLSERAGGTRAEDRLLLQNYTREIHSEQSSIEVAAEQQKKRGMKEQEGGRRSVDFHSRCRTSPQIGKSQDILGFR